MSSIQVYNLCKLGATLDPEHFQICQSLAFVGPEHDADCVADIQAQQGAYLPQLQANLQRMADSRCWPWSISRTRPGIAVAIVGTVSVVDPEPAVALLRAYLQFLQSTREATHEA